MPAVYAKVPDIKEKPKHSTYFNIEIKSKSIAERENRLTE